MQQKRKAAVGFIFVTLFLDVMGLGLIIPVLPSLVASLKGVPVNEASSYGAVLIFAYAFTQFFCAPIMGNLSDRFGRRPVLLLSLFGFSIDYLLLAWAPT
jgi:DHA1 family tetracycline resistance protein-like MFS transporter